MDPKYIVAIEIGSSKIHGAVAAVQPDGSLSVLAHECQRATGCVRYGRVSNVQEVSTIVNNILRKLENHPAILPRKIAEIYVGLGGRSFSSVPASATIDYNRELEITAEATKRLRDEAKFGIATTKAVLDLMPRRYFVNNKEVKNMVGTVGSSVRAEFTALLCKQDNRNNLERIKLDSPFLRRRHYLLRPLAIADMVLDNTERQLGCVLADLGAETTTVMVYKDGSLQYASTIPMGSRNVTLDLKIGLSLTEERAEQVKLTHGNAINERHGQQLSSEQVEINQYVHARNGEIIANIMHQVEMSGYKFSDLAGGIIMVGGGVRMRNFLQALTTQTKSKARTGTAENSISLCPGLDHDTDIDIIGLLRAAARFATESCLVVDEPERPDTSEAIGAAEPAAKRDRQVPDDDDLLDDDSDDEYEPKAKKGGFLTNLFGRDKKQRRNKKSRRSDDDDDTLRDDDDDDDDQLASPHDGYNAQHDHRTRQGARADVPQGLQDDMDDVEDAPQDDEQAKPSIFNNVINRVAQFLLKEDDANLDDRNN